MYISKSPPEVYITISNFVYKATYRHGTVLASIAVLCFFAILVVLNICYSPQECEPCVAGRQGDSHVLPDRANRMFVQETEYEYDAFLVVLVMSSPGNRERRNTIRSTWLTYQEQETMHFFVVGLASLGASEKKRLDDEHGEHDDMLLLTELHDAYSNLTQKLLLTFQWLDSHGRFQFVFKCDDDTFARINVIYTELKAANTSDRLYWGFFDGRAHVRKRGRWGEKEFVLCDRYLPYALGGGYVLSEDLVQFIAQNGHRFRQYTSEDVTVGTWLAPLELRRVHDPRFDTEYRSRGCLNAYIVTHKQSSNAMLKKHRNLKKANRLCLEETRARYSYKYNWNTAPSLCCIRNDTKVP